MTTGTQAPTRGTVTAVLANYNHGHLLAESLGSLLAQARPFDEVIVVDDCSTDDSVDRIRQLADDHPQVKLHVNEVNRGIAWNNNFGLEQATGDYIGFYAADDRYHESMVELLAGALDENRDVPLAGGAGQWIDEAGEPLPTWVGFSPAGPLCVDGTGYEALSTRHGPFLSGIACLYRRAALVQIGGFDPVLGAYQDAFVRERLASSAGACYVPDVVGYWRRSTTSYSAVSARRADTLAAILRQMSDTLAEVSGGVGTTSREYATRLMRRYRQQAMVGLIEAGRVSVATARSILPCRLAWAARLVAVASFNPRVARTLVSVLLVPRDFLADMRAARGTDEARQ